MARLDPEQARKVSLGFKYRPDKAPYDRGWRYASSLVGRGDYRCGICQAVFDRNDDVEVYEGERCHVACIIDDQAASA